MKEITLQFKGMIFEGLRFKGCGAYTDEYFDKLLEDDNPFSLSKYKDDMKNMLGEMLWIDLSWFFVTRVAFISLIILSLVFILTSWIAALVVLSASAICLIINRRLMNNAKMTHVLLENIDEILN